MHCAAPSWDCFESVSIPFLKTFDAFLDAKERCNARTRHGTFDTSVLEINRDDLKVFLETMCDTRDR